MAADIEFTEEQWHIQQEDLAQEGQVTAWRREEWERAHATLHTSWCGACNGTGVIDMPPVRDGSAQILTVELCPECVAQNRCPNCGGYTAFLDEEGDSNDPICPHCGWEFTL